MAGGQPVRTIETVSERHTSWLLVCAAPNQPVPERFSFPSVMVPDGSHPANVVVSPEGCGPFSRSVGTPSRVSSVCLPYLRGPARARRPRRAPPRVVVLCHRMLLQLLMSPEGPVDRKERTNVRYHQQHAGLHA